jgi:hypothetical protein
MALSAVGPAASGCGYLEDRLLDASDVIDLKYGRAWGLGAKAEATLSLGAGLGLAAIQHQREWYGRRSTVATYQGEGVFLHLGAFGFDSFSIHGGAPSNDGFHVLGVNLPALVDSEEPPIIERFRFGGELVLVHPLLGAYLNLGQVVDFLCGLATLDPAGDDGVPKSAPLREPFIAPEGEPVGERPAPEFRPQHRIAAQPGHGLREGLRAGDVDDDPRAEASDDIGGTARIADDGG